MVKLEIEPNRKSNSRFRKAAIPALFFCLILIASLASGTPGIVGSHAIDFTLQDIDGVSYTLSDFQGQVVVLNMMGWG